MTVKTLTIGQVAKKAGIGIETIRFYERQELLEEPARNSSGYRQYPEDVVSRLRFIKRAKELGFSLQESKELLGLRSDSKATCHAVKEKAKTKLYDIENKINDLVRIREALEQLISQCPGHGPTSDCLILSALDTGDINE